MAATSADNEYAALAAPASGRVPSSIRIGHLDAHVRRLLNDRNREIESRQIVIGVNVLPQEETMTPVTTYVLEIGTNAIPLGSDEAWVIQKRFSEFHQFRRELLQSIKQWEARADTGDSSFALMSNAVRRPLTNDFPRRHLRVDTPSIVNERKRSLLEFVRKLLNSYSELSVVFCVCELRADHSMDPLMDVWRKIEVFLNAPVAWAVAQFRRRRAVLALEDVVPSASSPVDSSFSCSICLDDDVASPSPDQHDDLPHYVQLPCQHGFHESCILDWFQTRITCPLCRLPVGTSSGPPQ